MSASPPVVKDPAALSATILAEEARRQEAASAEVDELPDDLLLGPEGEELSLRAVLRRGGLGMAGVLFALNLVDEFDRVALLVLGPDVQDTFGISDGALGAINGIGALLVFVGAIPLGVLADRTRRTTLIGITSLVWAAFALIGGLTRTAWQLALTRVFNGLGKGNTPAQSSLLADTYPIEGRGRVFALHYLANPVGSAVGPLLAGGVAAIAGGTEGWRWSLVVLAFPCLVFALAAFRLKEPARGAHEQRAVFGEEPETEVAAVTIDEQVPLAAGFARLKKISTFSSLMAGLGALGFAVAGAPTVFNLLLEERYGLNALERGLVGSVIALGAAAGTIVGGRYGDRLLRSDPPGLLRLIGAALAVFAVIYTVGLFMPRLWLLVVVHTVALGVVSAPLPSISAVVAAVVPFRLRGLGFAVVGIYLVLVGGFVGGFLTGAISDRLGERTALALVVPPACIVAGALVARGARSVRRDIALVVAELREDQREQAQAAAAMVEDVPLLQVRGLDFSYGQVQVLFDVSLDVRRGEVLALLGTNGAGKSTLLRAICGLSLPDRGTVRFGGRNITYLEAETRVGRGIVQVPGGKALFPDLTVTENLLAGAHGFIWDRRRVERRIEVVLELFPRLGERLDQPAETMSGGEQQMLALAKAMLLEPELLLVDELSLGLAPVVVQELLTTVEGLKETGVTMVIVEQSVNVALSIADRAVFMEKGSVRFEGPAAALLERDDLVRAVFLGGREGG